MKKTLAFLCAALLGIASGWAQINQGDIAAGANLVYGSKIENIGLGAKFQYTVIDHVRAEVGFNYFFKKHHQSMWDVNLNAHYLINVYQDRVLLYPIAGLSFASVENEFDKDINRIGLNLGAGAQYMLNDNVGVTLEYRHSIMKDIDQGVIGLGVNYKF